MIAITHVPSPKMEECQRSFVAPSRIDFELALRQHEQYCHMLGKCGAEVRTLRVNLRLPDCAFVEDTAIVLDEVAVLSSMGTEARRAEPAGIAPELRRFREVHPIKLPATIEGGDVLRVGGVLFVGLSSRTNQAGVAALEDIVCRYGYRVVPVPVHGCLHLKTACAALDDTKLLVNPAWVDTAALGGCELVRVAEEEPWGANVVRVGSRICVSANHPRTAATILAAGFDVQTVDVSEFAKAEGGVTCLSILFDPG